jgi:hypothetical protein
MIKFSMKKILPLLFTLLTINASGQKWAYHKVDENLTVYIPKNFEITDTLGQHIIKAPIDNALIMVQRVPNEGEGLTSVEDKDELIANYKGFQNGFVKSHQGELISQEMVEKGSLLMTQFRYHASINKEKQIRHCLVIFLNKNWYIIQFWEVESMTDELTSKREMLFSSIKFPHGQTLKNQLDNRVKISLAYRTGVLAGQYLGYLAMFSAFVLLLVWISKRIKRRSSSQLNENRPGN